MAASTLIETAKEAFANQKYEDTVRDCSKALSKLQPTGNHIDILDLRCQAYTKLGKLDSALQDARRIIHASKRQSPVGYLRCSQIEKLSENYIAARKWLEHGIKNVPDQRRAFEAHLNKIENVIAINLQLQKRRDPIVSMPLEILQLILSYLEYSQCVRLLRVSRAWRTLLFQIPPFVCEIDFTCARKQVSFRAWKSLSQYLRRHPKKLILCSLSPPVTKAVQDWLSKSSNLETVQDLHIERTDVSISRLRYENLKCIRSLRVTTDQGITFNSLQRLISACQNLQELFVQGNLRESVPLKLECQQLCLRDLRLIQVVKNGIFTMPSIILKNWPNLETLTLSGVVFTALDQSAEVLDLSSHCNLQRLSLTTVMNTRLELKLPESLLDLTCKDVGPSHTLYRLSTPTLLCNLHTVNLSNTLALHFIQAVQQSDKVPRIRHAYLHDLAFSETSLAETMGPCSIFTECTDLSFSSPQLRDSDANSFTALFPAIENLTLTSHHISGNFISDLLRPKSCQLRQVVLRDCVKVSSDIVPWLSSRSIGCRIVNSADESSGHRLRGTY